jgi:hypothetical protein
MLKNKLIPLLIICILISGKAPAQNFLLDALNSFTEMNESFVKLVKSFANIDDYTNKEKSKTMAKELYGNVGSLILAKDSIIFTLENDVSENPDFTKSINLLKDKLQETRTTLSKYNSLLTAAGINAQKLNYDLQQDFLQKSLTLQKASVLLQNNSLPDTRRYLALYFRGCVIILKDAQRTLDKYLKLEN